MQNRVYLGVLLMGGGAALLCTLALGGGHAVSGVNSKPSAPAAPLPTNGSEALASVARAPTPPQPRTTQQTARQASAHDPRSSAQTAKVGQAEESALMDMLRSFNVIADPEGVLVLAREGSARFPRGADAAERGWYEARALVELGRMDEAVAVARALLEQHPDASWTADVRRHLLSHPVGER
jgi:hypothetical protein